MGSRDFLRNRNINETNSLPDLVQGIDPLSDDDVNVIDHSLYYSDLEYQNLISQGNGVLRILYLNCGGLNAKFNKLKNFLSEFNKDKFPVSIITLQETHLLPNTDVNFFQLPGYTLVYGFASINTFGGVAIYMHDSFSFERLDIELFHQISTVFESILFKVYNNHCKHQSYVISSIYNRRSSDLIADLTQFTNEFSVVLSQGRKSMFKHGGDNIGEKYTSRLRDVLPGAKRRALLGGFGRIPPEDFFLNGAIWWVLVYIWIRFCL